MGAQRLFALVGMTNTLRTPSDATGLPAGDFPMKKGVHRLQWTPSDVMLVELGGFEPPSASLHRAVLHV